MDLSLVMFKADGTRRDFPVTKDRIVIGRKPNCDLRIPLTSVSRQHCELRVDDGKAYVKDLGSSNGTFHNSVRVQEQALSPGDEVVVGPVVFTVVIDGEPAEIEPVRTVLDKDSSGSGPAEATQSPSSHGLDAGVQSGDDSAEALVALEDDDDAAAEGASGASGAAGAAGAADDADQSMAIEIEPEPEDELEPAEQLDEASPPTGDGQADAGADPQAEAAEPTSDDDQSLELNDAADNAPQELSTDDNQMPEQVEEESHSPTVDLDDPIAALERLAEVEEGDESNTDQQDQQDSEDDDDLQVLWDDDDDDKNKGGQH